MGQGTFDESDETDADSTLNALVDVEEDAEEDVEGDATVLAVRDLKYSFEDGNVTFRVRRALFKVHASLLKVHSEDFFGKINPALLSDCSTLPGGTCNENAIDIPDIQPSQLRNLLRIIYCLPSNNVIFDDNKAVVDAFDCYLDVAILSRKFGMEAMQQWAKNKLSELAHNSGRLLVAQLDDYYADEWAKPDSNRRGDYVPDQVNEEDKVSVGFPYYSIRFVEAIQYAKDVSQCMLLHDMLSILESYLIRPNREVKLFISFFRIPDLRETDPSLFGFFFLLLLDCGNLVWVMKVFSQENCMVLFAAQSFLKPLPKSLKAGVAAPLFARPTHASEFAVMFPGDENCEAGCLQDISSTRKRLPLKPTTTMSTTENSRSQSKL
ncbi:hypothetical protein B0J17DRAFT_720659 [Rhizoctonia solani]|nr:hypothetical protein B0J17DRAFT_720659 [Rhizoctonia solani]